MTEDRPARLAALRDLYRQLDEECAVARQELRSSREGMGGDDDVESVNQALALRLDQILDHRREVAEAIERLTDADGAVCEDCGQPIPAARFEANPTAVRCVACQRRADSIV